MCCYAIPLHIHVHPILSFEDTGAEEACKCVTRCGKVVASGVPLRRAWCRLRALP